MQIGADQQYSSANAIEPHQVRPTPQGIHVDPSMFAPGIQVEGLRAVFLHAMGMYDFAPGADKNLQQIRRILDHVNIQPEHPVMILQRVKQQMIPGLCENLPAWDLECRLPAGNSIRYLKMKLFLP